MKWKFESHWVYISIFLYGLVRLIEYTTGQMGSPTWAIDFMPYWSLLGFWIVDNFLNYEERSCEK